MTLLIWLYFRYIGLISLKFYFWLGNLTLPLWFSFCCCGIELMRVVTCDSVSLIHLPSQESSSCPQGLVQKQTVHFVCLCWEISVFLTASPFLQGVTYLTYLIVISPTIIKSPLRSHLYLLDSPTSWYEYFYEFLFFLNFLWYLFSGFY